MKWEKGQVRRALRLREQIEIVEEGGWIGGPFGLVKIKSHSPWVLIEQASGLKVASFRLKCNAQECARIIAAHWGEDSRLDEGRADELLRDMRITLTKYGHADRRVIEKLAAEDDVQGAVTIVDNVRDASAREEQDSAPLVTWGEIESWLASAGWSAGEGKWLIGCAHQSVQMLVTLDPDRRRGLLEDVIDGLCAAMRCGRHDLRKKITGA